jgi:replicative DNA helicase
MSPSASSEDFYTRPHRHIFTEMARLQESGSPIDLITLAESLERLGQLDSCGGFAYLAELSKNTPSAANISAYADIVRERAVVREMISVANEIAEAGFDPQGRSSEDLLDLAESRVFKIAESRANKDEGPKNIADVLDATVAYRTALPAAARRRNGRQYRLRRPQQENRRPTAVGLDYRRGATFDG